MKLEEDILNNLKKRIKDNINSMKNTQIENRYLLIAKQLEKYLNEYNVTLQDIIDSGVSKQQVYSVFRRGKTSLINYRMNTLFNVISSIEQIIRKKTSEKITVKIN